MERQYQKKSYTLFWAWLLLLAGVVVFFTFNRGYFPTIGSGKNLGILVLVLLDLLFLLILITQSIYWISGVTYEAAAAADSGARRRYAFWHFVIFLAATFLFLYYCFGMKSMLRADSTRDSLVAGGMVCAAAVVSTKIRLK